MAKANLIQILTDNSFNEIMLKRLNRYVATHGHFRERDKSIDLFGIRQLPIEAKVRKRKINVENLK